MKIAIPYWEGKISPVMDTASRLLILQVENQSETSRQEVLFAEGDLNSRCNRIRDLGIELLICGAISGPFYRMLKASGIKIISWISGQVNEVLAAYLSGSLNLERFLMPGCQNVSKGMGKAGKKS